MSPDEKLAFKVLALFAVVSTVFWALIMIWASQ